MDIDIFNGDADGIAALQQLRLAEPRRSVLVSGVKRDIRLLDKVVAMADHSGARLTVLDISMATNNEPLVTLLKDNCQVFYADHHHPGAIPKHSSLTCHIDPDPEICTGLIINRLLAGRFPGWGVVAAFGDNLHDSADHLGKTAQFSGREMGMLRELGELLNYNGYGKEVADLHFDPVTLFQEIQPYQNPLEFYAASDALATLRQGFHDDMAQARAVEPEAQQDTGRIYIFPCLPWARRTAGVFSNERAREEPDKAHALLVDDGQGGYVVSVRAPLNRKKGALDLCQAFATGGGRAAAAGINKLPAALVQEFTTAFFTAFKR
ncbi:MAG: acetyltransferase [Proteobacteria bacterium]|nr:acetyltransferase [Pseudomonadota bacterium]